MEEDDADGGFLFEPASGSSGNGDDDDDDEFDIFEDM